MSEVDDDFTVTTQIPFAVPPERRTAYNHTFQREGWPSRTRWIQHLLDLDAPDSDTEAAYGFVDEAITRLRKSELKVVGIEAIIDVLQEVLESLRETHRDHKGVPSRGATTKEEDPEA